MFSSKVSWKTSLCQFGFGRKTSSTTILHIHPPVVIANLLPIDILFRLEVLVSSVIHLFKSMLTYICGSHRMNMVNTRTLPKAKINIWCNFIESLVCTQYKLRSGPILCTNSEGNFM